MQKPHSFFGEKLMDNPCESFLNVLSIDSSHSPKYYDMVVFSHIRWDNDDSRPLQLLSRLSKELHILYVEEPIAHHQADKFTAEIKTVNERLTVLRPRVDSIDEIATVLPLFVSNYYIPVGWFYSPLFNVMNDWFSFYKVVYDCIDDISIENGFTRKMVDLEKELIAKSDIVLTLGKRSFEMKSKLHDNVYFFPGRTERLHFADALEGNEIPEEFRRMHRPIIGFAGDIDASFDFELVANAANLAHAASFVVAGSFKNIDKTQLPQAANIHYLDCTEQQKMKSFIKNFDIVMFPFRPDSRPQATLLEAYADSAKPQIATVVPELLAKLENTVNLISNGEDFLATVIEILMADELLRRKQESYFEYVLNKNSWDWTASRIAKILRSS